MCYEVEAPIYIATRNPTFSLHQHAIVFWNSIWYWWNAIERAAILLVLKNCVMPKT